MNRIEWGKTEWLGLLNPETRLILYGFDKNRAIQSVDFESIDPKQLLFTLSCHRLTTGFYERIKNNAHVPPALSVLLKEQQATDKLRMLTHMAELCRIVDLLKRQKIAVIVLKGPMLSHLYYPDYTERTSNDLDILVQPNQLEAALSALTEISYSFSETLWNTPGQKSAYLRTFHHYHLYNPNTGIQLELHWRLNTPGGGNSFDLGKLWQNAVNQPIGGAAMQTLGNVDNFIYLCLHGGTHDWKRLFWLSDIVQILDREGDVFLLDAYTYACKQNTGRFVLLAVFLVQNLFGRTLPEPIRIAINQDKTMLRLAANCLFMMNDTSLPYQPPFSTGKSFRYSLKKLLKSYQSMYYLGRLQSLLTAFKQFFINPAYWTICPLSDRVFALNYIVAPFIWVIHTLKKSRR